jgi:hypothetical protein
VSRQWIIETKDNRMMDFDYLKAIRDQVIFVAAFFSIFGLIMTDSYYATFGLRYQFLQLSATHIIYRGFTLIYFNPPFMIIFVVIIGATLASQFRFQIRIGGRKFSRSPVIYTVLGVALLSGGYLAFSTGANTAVQDMYKDTTSLRQITHFTSANQEKTNLVREMMTETAPLLLLHSSDREIVIFNPPTFRASRPRIDVYHVGLAADDFYSDRTPFYR